MLGSFNSMILRLRTSVLVASFGVFALAACASSENATFDETTPEADAGSDVKTPDAASDSGDGTGGSGGDGGEAGAGGAGGTGGDSGDDTCGLSACPEPTYPDFFKCCTTTNECGYKNGPSGFCYAVEEPGTGGAGGGP